MSQSNGKQLNRRQFIRGAAKTVGGLIAVPTIVSSTALGKDGRVPASERIILGGIGIGSRGTHDLKWMLPEVQRIDPSLFYVIEQARDMSKVLKPVYSPLGGWRSAGKRK